MGKVVSIFRSAVFWEYGLHVLKSSCIIMSAVRVLADGSLVGLCTKCAICSVGKCDPQRSMVQSRVVVVQSMWSQSIWQTVGRRAKNEHVLLGVFLPTVFQHCDQCSSRTRRCMNCFRCALSAPDASSIV